MGSVDGSGHGPTWPNTALCQYESKPQLRGGHIWTLRGHALLHTSAYLCLWRAPYRHLHASLWSHSFSSNSAEGLNMAQEDGGAAGCQHRKSWVQHKVRGVNSRVSLRATQPDLGQIFKSNSYCVFSPVWSGRWAEGTTILRNAATGGNMIVLSLLQQCVVSFT